MKNTNKTNMFPKSIVILISLIVIGLFISLGVGIGFFYSKGGFDNISNQSLVVTSSKNVIEEDIIDEPKVDIYGYRKRLGDILGEIHINSMSLQTECNLISNYWHSAIFSNKDIDRAINDALVKITDIYKQIENPDAINPKIISKQIKNDMENLANPPKEYKEMYDLTMDIYGYYLNLYRLSTKPSGTYDSYVSNIETSTMQLHTNFKKVFLLDPNIKIGSFTKEQWEYISAH